MSEDAADCAAERLSYLAQQVAEETLRRELLHLLLLKLLRIGLLQLLHRISLEGQQATAYASSHLSDLAAEAGIAKKPPDAFADQTAKRSAKHAAEQALRRQLLSTIATPLLNTIHGRSSCLSMKRMSMRHFFAASPW